MSGLLIPGANLLESFFSYLTHRLESEAGLIRLWLVPNFSKPHNRRVKGQYLTKAIDLSIYLSCQFKSIEEAIVIDCKRPTCRNE